MKDTFESLQNDIKYLEDRLKYLDEEEEKVTTEYAGRRAELHMMLDRKRPILRDMEARLQAEEYNHRTLLHNADKKRNVAMEILKKDRQQSENLAKNSEQINSGYGNQFVAPTNERTSPPESEFIDYGGLGNHD